MRVVWWIRSLRSRNETICHSGRENALIDLLNLRVDRLQRRFGVRALAQKQTALDNVLIVDDFAVRPLYRLAHLAQADLGSLLDGRDIADPHRSSVLGLDDCFADVIHIAHQADHADVDLLKADLDKAAAGIAVISG